MYWGKIKEIRPLKGGNLTSFVTFVGKSRNHCEFLSLLRTLNFPVTKHCQAILLLLLLTCELDKSSIVVIGYQFIIKYINYDKSFAVFL